MRGRSSSPVTSKLTRMALRKQVVKDGGGVPSGSQKLNENTQENEAVDVLSDQDELSPSLTLAREKHRRERETKSKPAEMTEEQMIDLALRLSEQEASVTALRLQQEEDTMKKAIQDSMVGQTQPSQSQRLLPAAASLRLSSRRKLLYSEGKRTSAVDQGASGDVCQTETHISQERNKDGDKKENRNKKRKRTHGSPLLEMPDLSQTQKICSQASDSLSEQSSDSNQKDDCQLRKSPVFPLTGCRAEVHVPRLSQDLLETCRTSGFVLCSSDSLTSTQPCLPVHHRSPTFAKSPCDTIECPKSPVFSETNQGDGCKMELSPERGNSPVFGRNPQHDGSSSACKPHILICANSGILNSSQESVTSSVRFVSCQPESAELPRSPALPRNLRSLERSTSPVFSETHQRQTEQSHGCSTSPVFGTTGQQHESQLEKTSCVVPSAAELRGSDIKVNSPGVEGPSQSPRPDDKTEWSEGGRPKTTTSSQSDDAQELTEAPKKCNSPTAERTSNITLLSSDEDNNVTPVGSPSPVFPEERPVQQADVQAAALNHVASPGTPESSSSQLSTTEQDPQPASSEGVAIRAIAQAREPTGGQTVHYYWGVPFCPRGLDPDSYTQVILAQLEVYEKSLKQAQRCLLRKAEWGEAILPQPQKSPSPESASESPQPHVLRRLRRRGKKQCEAADSSPAEAEEDEDKEEEEGEREKNKEEKNERGEGEGGQVEADDFDVCPETQLSDNDSMQDLQVDTDDGAKLRSESPERPEVEIILQDSPAGDELQEEEEEMEVDAPREGKMEEKIPVCTNVGGQDVRKDTDGGHPDVKEVKDCELRRSVSPELEFGPIPSTPETSVDCPICQGSFPATEIELHAAYCYTEVAVVDERRPEVGSLQVSLKPRRTRTRRADVSAEETHNPSNKRQEKCYVCQKMVCGEDFGHHTELCIQRHALKCEAKGNLLSALEQTDQDSEAGPSGFRLQPGDIIDLRDDDDDDGGGEDEEEFRISDSPIRSFTSISEATDCLIDFRKQPRAKKLSRRRR
ncbi:BRCA1-A complex subunit RAP80 isoform X2 [Mastacembelus armatus]|uniref:Ubiquitin interaction motif containing 1 n=1 Tax=Mastacembelus armatus TaxID=205130 RepID=A0A3Q3SZF9_9TELE|nr:BRCA1-A complex subunit RAP80-like isoform X2 [Mastacembelus armatus]